MKPYGIHPLSKWHITLDMGTIADLEPKSRLSGCRNSSRKRKTRRYWKRRARRQGKTEIKNQLNWELS